MPAFKYNSMAPIIKSEQLRDTYASTALGKIKVLLYLQWLSKIWNNSDSKMIIFCSDNGMSHIQRKHEYLYIFFINQEYKRSFSPTSMYFLMFSFKRKILLERC